MSYTPLEQAICAEALALTGVDITNPRTSVQKLVHDIFLVRYYGSIGTTNRFRITCLGGVKQSKKLSCNETTFSKEGWPAVQVKDDGIIAETWGSNSRAKDNGWYMVNHALSFVLHEALKVLPISNDESMRAALIALCAKNTFGNADKEGDNIEYALFTLLSPDNAAAYYDVDQTDAVSVTGKRYFSIDRDNKERFDNEKTRLADASTYGPLVMFPVYMGDKAVEKSKEARTEAVSGTDADLFRAAAVAAQASNKTIGIETSEVTAFTQDGVVFIGTA